MKTLQIGLGSALPRSGCELMPFFSAEMHDKVSSQLKWECRERGLSLSHRTEVYEDMKRRERAELYGQG